MYFLNVWDPGVGEVDKPTVSTFDIKYFENTKFWTSQRISCYLWLVDNTDTEGDPFKDSIN